MSENVLTDDEVAALLDGVRSGEVEVQSAQGPRYASVKPFEIPRRSRLASKSFPTLELLNQKFAEQLRKRTQQLFNCELGVNCSETVNSLFGDICRQHDDILVAVEFAAPPLTGRGAIVFGAELVQQLVELFFGGAGSKPKAPGRAVFTLGELRVTHAFSNIVLAILKEMWEPIQTIDPEQLKSESSVSLLDIADETDPVIKNTFDFSFEEHDGALHLLLPKAMVETLLPLFKGADRKHSPGQDKLWADAIHTGLTDVSVNLSSHVGHTSMTLGELIRLEPGDVIKIDSPRIATICAQNIPLLEGRFGVHGGCNAVEATKWLGADLKKPRRGGTHD